MKKWQRVNLFVFLAMIFVTVSLVYVLGKMDFSTLFGKPWHLQPSVHEDSLSTIYKDNYQIMGKAPLRPYLYDTSRTNVFILVDAWGVPTEESVLAEDFKTFENIPHKFALHRRLANYTSHAEHAEFRNNLNSLFLFGGESLQFNRTEYIPEIGFQQALYCSNCPCEAIIGKIDSILAEPEHPQFIAWTALASTVGNHNEIRQVLGQIANLAKKHPDVQFVIQGTHRPVLCGPEIRNSYKAHWVPVAVLN
ncbi:MAG: hypothetical protein IKS02_01310 [Fibrobacter sp.]|nr:hypothetical protein [Fibrobacter sp.]